MHFQAISLPVFLSPLLFLLLTSNTSAFQIAERIPQALGSRAATSGGWSLALSVCPANSQLQACSGFCCPNTLTCVLGSAGNRCCPAGTDCLAVYQASPQCADDSWALWNVTTKGPGFFCCLPGQIGTNDQKCVAGNSPVVATLSAQLISAANGAAGTGTATASSTPASSPATSSLAASSTAIITPSVGPSPTSKAVSPSSTSPLSSSPTTSSLVVQTSKSEAKGSVIIEQSLFYGVLFSLVGVLL